MPKGTKAGADQPAAQAPAGPPDDHGGQLLGVMQLRAIDEHQRGWQLLHCAIETSRSVCSWCADQQPGQQPEKKKRNTNPGVRIQVLCYRRQSILHKCEPLL